MSTILCTATMDLMSAVNGASGPMMIFRDQSGNSISLILEGVDSARVSRAIDALNGEDVAGADKIKRAANRCWMVGLPAQVWAEVAADLPKSVRNALPKTPIERLREWIDAEQDGDPELCFSQVDDAVIKWAILTVDRMQARINRLEKELERANG